MKHLILKLLILLLFILPVNAATAQQMKEQAAPEPVITAPVNPVAVVVDMRDGFWCQAWKTIDLDGEERVFTLIHFPKRYLTGPDTWLTGVREALVHFYGCETFKDCTPTFTLRTYSRESAVGVLTADLPDNFSVYIFTLVSSPTSHAPIGIALID